jgi:hypothetical protein
MDERISRVVEQATAGLQGDPELRIDVSAELTNHLEVTAAGLMAEGMTEEEASAQALETFGEPLEMAGDLLEANKRRMTLRARLRLLVQAVLIPAAVLVAIFIGYNSFARLVGLHRTVNDWRGEAMYMPALPQFPVLRMPGQRRQQQEIERKLALIPNKTINTEELLALWQPFQGTPDGRMVLGYYTGVLFDKSDLSQPLRLSKWERSEHELFVQAMQLGEQIDPQNALYNYKLAYLYLRPAITSREERNNKTQGDEVHDRRLLTLGLAELRKALAKPAIHEYKGEMLDRRLAVLPPPHLTEDYLQRFDIMASGLYPNFATQRALGRKMLGCARVLVAEGRVDEARPLLEAWHIVPSQMLEHAISLIEILVARSLAQLLGEGTAAIYDSIGEHENAARVRADVVRFTAPVSIRKEQRHRQADHTSSELLARHGSTVSASLAPVFAGLSDSPPYTVETLAPTRRHEMALLEQFSLSMVLLLLVLVMVAALLAQTCWFYKLRAASSAPLLLLPSWQASARIIGLGILAPLALYYLYTHSPIGGREYGIAYMRWRFFAELALVGMLLVWLPGMLASRDIRRRCRHLGVPVAAAPHPIWRVLKTLLWTLCFLSVSAGIALLILMLFSATTMYLTDETLLLLRDIAFVTVSSTFIVGNGLFLRWLIRRARQRRHAAPQPLPSNALYRGTVARSLVPVYAVAIILLAMTAQPYLLHQEAKWLREDRLFNPHDVAGTGGLLTPVEAAVTKQLRQEMLQAAQEIERHGATSDTVGK